MPKDKEKELVRLEKEDKKKNLDKRINAHKKEVDMAGNEVEVIEGPMTGVKGIVVRLKGQDRLVIKIDAIQQALSIDIDSRYIKNIYNRIA